MGGERKRERFIRRTLRRVARQRVRGVIGGIWGVERGLILNEETEAALRTCHMRGWIEVLQDSIPYGSLNPDGSLPANAGFTRTAPIYRLTEGGWSFLHRLQLWVLVTCALSFASLIATLIFGLMQWKGK